MEGHCLVADRAVAAPGSWRAASLTRFLAEARPEVDRPGWLEHTFYVEADKCDDAAACAVALASVWPAKSGASSELDDGMWIDLARVSCVHGGLNVTQWQTVWLRAWLGLTDGDEVKHSIRFDKAPPAEPPKT